MERSDNIEKVRAECHSASVRLMYIPKASPETFQGSGGFLKYSQNHEQAGEKKSYVQHQQSFRSMMGSGIGTEIEGQPFRVGGFEDHPAGVLNQLCGDLDLTRRVRTQLIPDLKEPKEQ